MNDAPLFPIKKLSLPNLKEWGNYSNNLDLINMYKVFNGKKIENVYYYYKSGMYISISHELLYSNKNIFQYYIYSYILYLLSDLGKDDDEGKDVFVRLIKNKEEKEKNSVKEIFENKVNLFYFDKNFNKYLYETSIKDMIIIINSDYINMKINNNWYKDIPKNIKILKEILNFKIEIK